MATIDELIGRNQSGTRRGAAVGHPKLCLVYCDDAVLSGRLESALGLVPGEAAVIRLPAASGAVSEEALQRAVAKAVFLEGCEEVLLVSHASCSLGQVTANSVIDAVQKRNVSRAQIPFDLREWIGAGRDPRQSVGQSAELLRRCAYLPTGIRVDVAHFQDDTGAVELTDRGLTAGPMAAPSGTMAGYQSGPVPPPAEVAPSSAAFAPSPASFAASDAAPEVTLFVPRAAAAPAARRLGPTPPPTPVKEEKVGPALKLALEEIRTFISSELNRAQRETLDQELTDATSSDAMVKLLLKQIMRLGDRRNRILDELELVQDQVSAMHPSRARQILRALVMRNPKA